jgi:hypothetical protein
MSSFFLKCSVHQILLYRRVNWAGHTIRMGRKKCIQNFRYKSLFRGSWPRIRWNVAEKNIPVITQPPYSLGLAPGDFLLFPTLKMVPQGDTFRNHGGHEIECDGRALEDSKVHLGEIKMNPREMVILCVFLCFCEHGNESVTWIRGDKKKTWPHNQLLASEEGLCFMPATHLIAIYRKLILSFKSTNLFCFKTYPVAGILQNE